MARPHRDYTLDGEQARRDDHATQALWLNAAARRLDFYRNGSPNLHPDEAPKPKRWIMVAYELGHIRRCRVALKFAERLP